MKRRKLLALGLSVVMTVSMTISSLAQVEQYNDGQSHTVDSSIINQDPDEVAVSAQGSGTSVTVNGDVDSEGKGAWSWEGASVEINGSVSADKSGVGTWDAGTTMTVNGDVISGDGNTAVANDGSELTVTGDAASMSSTKSSVVSQNGSSVTVNGNAENLNATTTGDHVPNTVLVKDDSSAKIGGDVESTAYGVSATRGSEVEIGGSVHSDLRGVSARSDSKVSVGKDVISDDQEGVIAKEQSEVTVGGSINSFGTGVNSIDHSKVEVTGDVLTETTGVYAIGDSTVKVGGNVSGADYNVLYAGDETFPVDNSSITVGGDVKADQGRAAVANSGASITVEGSITATGAAAVDMTSDSNVTVKKDVTGDSGLVIRETSSQGGGAAVVLGTVTETAGDGYCITVSGDALTKEDVVKALPTIIVGELSSANQQYVEYKDKSGQGSLDTNAVAQAIAEQILYHIEVQEAKNGNISLGGTKKEQGYDVAHAGDTVTVTVTPDNGYEIKSVDGGKATAVKNADGSWSITVPKTGGVSVSAIIEALAIVAPSSKNGDDGGNDPQQQTPAQDTSIKTTTNDNKQIKVDGVVTSPAKTVSGVVVDDGASGTGSAQNHVEVCTGVAKTSGLDADVVSCIAKIDGGDLAGAAASNAFEAQTAAALNGKNVFGGTMAVRISPKNIPVSLYAPGFPASSVPQILFFNNNTGRWEILAATLDQASGLINFVMPDDGTVVIVY